MYNFRTDLASERRDIYKKANKLESEIDGIESTKEEKDENIKRRAADTFGGEKGCIRHTPLCKNKENA